MDILHVHRSMIIQKATIVKEKFKFQRGVTLLSMAIIIVVIGTFMGVALNLYKVYKPYEAAQETDQKITKIRRALEQYYYTEGYYPCPAPLNVAVDQNGFGFSVVETSVAVPGDGDCSTASSDGSDGTFLAAGYNGLNVRTGAVPVRTLNLPDEYIYDGYNQRFVYAVTEAYSQKGNAPEPGTGGGIVLEDLNGNEVFSQTGTEDTGKIIHLVFSMGGDPNGAYSAFSGSLESACDTTKFAGENCDWSSDAEFVNTLQKSGNEKSANYFMHKISYGVSRDILSCEEKMGPPPKNIAFLMDTSGSMGDSAGAGNCPSDLGVSSCKRIDVARWAMRRIVPTVINEQKRLIPEDEDNEDGNNDGNDVVQYEEGLEPGEVSITGFIELPWYASGDYNSSDTIKGRIEQTDPVFYNPEDDADRNDDDTATQLNDHLMSRCPSGNTPLGVHIEALAKMLGDGGDERPNKVTVISDGYQSAGAGTDPVHAAQYIHDTYPNVEVDIIDVSPEGNSELRKVAEQTGGAYYTSTNPDELLDALKKSAGICEIYNPVKPVDELGSCRK